MVKSFRWRLRIWLGLMLIAVVGSFASLLYWNVRSSRLGEVDSQLLSGAQTLAAAIRGLPPHELHGDRPGPREEPPPPPHNGARPEAQRRELPNNDAVEPPRAGRREASNEPPRDRAFEARRPPPRRRPPPPPPGEPYGHALRVLADLDLPANVQTPPDDPGGPAYFRIWLGDGELLKASAGAPPMSQGAMPSDLLDGEYRFERRRGVREVALGGPDRSLIVVGRPIGRELHELNQLALQLAVIGALVAAAGVLGGAVLARHVVRPLEEMSAAAAAISAANLSQRIDPTTFDLELQGLARTLNETFARLEAAFERQSRFTADASHELRTPLSVLSTHLEFALSRGSLNEEQRETLEACQRASRRMNSLVAALLTLARADAGNLARARQPCDLASIVEECIDMLRPIAAEKQIELTLEAVPCEINGDPALLAQVVMNLLTNAIRYNHAGGRVAATVNADAGDAVLVVEDSGPGIPLADQPRLFERFYRVDQARSREDGGNGLGLSIVKSILDAHGGQIDLVSQPGQGSRFTVRLPLNAEPAETAS